jgi:hypothetical protein
LRNIANGAWTILFECFPNDSSFHAKYRFNRYFFHIATHLYQIYFFQDINKITMPVNDKKSSWILWPNLSLLILGLKNQGDSLWKIKFDTLTPINLTFATGPTTATTGGWTLAK